MGTAHGVDLCGPLLAADQPRHRHGRIGTEVVRTRFGDFAFQNGYPTPDAADALLGQIAFNRAIEVYLTQIPAVAVIEQRRGMREFGARRANQVIIWETLMDAQTLLLTANTETVYSLGFLDLKTDGPTVIEVPPKLLGLAMDTLQRYLVDIGPLGPDKGQGGAGTVLPAGGRYREGQGLRPDPAARARLAEATRAAAAIARANCFASNDPATFYYPDRHWQAISDVPYTFVRDGVFQLARRAFVYYMGLGNSPAMMAKNVGAGSQYLWTYKDADGNFLDGAENYRLRAPAEVPINNVWSVVIYDALGRSELQNGQPLPSVSQYGEPKVNADGSVAIFFGPEMPQGQERNWIRTVPGRGWFPIFRFYGPLEPFFDKSWKLDDVEKL